MKLHKPIKDYVFVTAQFILFILYVLPIHFLKMQQLTGLLSYSGAIVLGISLVLGTIALLQLNTKLSPFPSPVNHGKLITNGVFKISRHPIYTALIFSGFGYAIYVSSFYKVLITSLLFILFYYKSVYEEKLLCEKFTEYIDYKKKTRRFI